MPVRTTRTFPEKLFTGGVIIFLVILALIPVYTTVTNNDGFTLQDAEYDLGQEIPNEATDIELEFHREYQAGGFRLSFNLPAERSAEFTSHFCDGVLIEGFVWANGSKLPPQHYGYSCRHKGRWFSIEVDQTNSELYHIIIYVSYG